MAHLYVNCPPHWNQNDQRYSESFTRSLSLKVNSPPKLHLNNLQDYQDSSSSKSTQPNRGVTPYFGTDSWDQRLSSESGQEVSCAKDLGQAQAQAKQICTIMGLPNASYGTGQVDYDPTLGCMPLPHPGSDPYYNGLVTAFGTSPVPLMMGMTSTRVPLPVDRSISEDEPIYVNAKQYHGILRRRQSRAKMEAQNKLIKIRKPYLHESRHLHALKRVRGSGGRFLSTKKQQKPDSVNTNGYHSVSDSNSFTRNGNHNLVFEPVQSHVGRVNCNAGFFQQSESGFLGISSSLHNTVEGL